MKKAIALICGARRSVCAASLYAISAQDGLEGVPVFVGDTEDITLWSDEGCRGALEMINARTRLHYIRTVKRGAGQNRTELYQSALGVLPDECALLSIDDDCALPENFLSESDKNIAAAPGDWGFIGHYSFDVLNPNREWQILQGARPVLAHQDAWQGCDEYNDRLRTSYDASGVALWLRVGALRGVLPAIIEMSSFYGSVEDGFTCMPISTSYPCFVALSPWVRHYRTRETSRDYKDTTRIEQAAVFTELKRRGFMTGKGKQMWHEQMAFCGHDLQNVKAMEKVLERND